MARTLTTITLGTGIVDVSAPVPRHGIGVLEGIGLTLRGWADALRNRDVADTDPTHSLHGLLRAHRRREGEVVRSIDAGLSALDVRLADIESHLGDPLETAASEPGSAELASLRGADRADWAERVRDARRSAERARAGRASAAALRAEHARLTVERRNLVAEGEDVRRLWREAFELRAARYTRARFGFLGRRPAIEPAVAAYRFSDGPHEVRSN